MFCPFCAVQLGDAPKFCPSCGQNVGFLTQLPSTPSTSSSEGCGPTVKETRKEGRAAQFLRFREVKEAAERRTSFSKLKKKQAITVKISIGIMSRTKNGLKPQRGKTMPLNVEPQWSTTQILPAALKKQQDFNQNAMDDGEYVLLYPDGSQVENIPGTDRPFVLEHYKEAIGKSYQRITLYICLLQDLSKY
ncbi:unnamed protein product [Arctogadus glacialis]